VSKKVTISLSFAECPFCKDGESVKDEIASDKRIVHRLKYSEVHLSCPEIEDFEGWVEECDNCGIYFVNPRYDEQEFALLYKNLSRKGAGFTLVKNVAAWPTRFAITSWHAADPIYRFGARLVGKVLDPVLQMPIPTKPIQAGGRILDVGCGDGFHLRCLNAEGIDLYATEIHPGYEAILSTGPEKIRFWIKEFTSVDWENEIGYESFDLIIFQSVFYRLNNPKESLDLAWKLLKPGGSILRIEPFCPDLDDVKFITRFNFPQGFTFVHDLNTYISRLKNLYPEAKFDWKIYYGRSNKTRTGNEFNTVTACLDIISRTLKTALKKEPYFLRFDMIKPEKNG